MGYGFTIGELAAGRMPCEQDFAIAIERSMGDEGLGRAIAEGSIRGAAIYGSMTSEIGRPGSDVDILILDTRVYRPGKDTTPFDELRADIFLQQHVNVDMNSRGFTPNAKLRFDAGAAWFADYLLHLKPRHSIGEDYHQLIEVPTTKEVRRSIQGSILTAPNKCHLLSSDDNFESHASAEALSILRKQSLNITRLALHYVRRAPPLTPQGTNLSKLELVRAYTKEIGSDVYLEQAAALNESYLSFITDPGLTRRPCWQQEYRELVQTINEHAKDFPAFVDRTLDRLRTH